MQALASADIFSIICLAIILLGLAGRKNKSRSVMIFVAVDIATIICCLSDALSYLLQGGACSDLLLFIIWIISYAFGSVTLFCFIYFCYAYTNEKMKINKWFLLGPMHILLLSAVYVVIVGVTGRIVNIENGVATVTGGMPKIVTIIQLIFIIYLPIVATLKREILGEKTVFLLTSFGVLPAIAMCATLLFGVADYSYPASSISIMMIYILLLNKEALDMEREKRMLLLEKNISLEEKQSELEESACEQEAQLEEITALN